MPDPQSIAQHRLAARHQVFNTTLALINLGKTTAQGEVHQQQDTMVSIFECEERQSV